MLFAANHFRAIRRTYIARPGHGVNATPPVFFSRIETPQDHPAGHNVDIVFGAIDAHAGTATGQTSMLRYDGPPRLISSPKSRFGIGLRQEKMS
jgi:hypothetical protein